MKHIFFVNDDFFNNTKWHEALVNRTWIDEFVGDFILASLIYPTFDVEINVNNNDGKLDLAYFSCIQGMKANLWAEHQYDGMEWRSDDYTGDICEVDFSKSTWKEDLEKEMVKVAENYAKKKGYSFDKPNF